MIELKVQVEIKYSDKITREHILAAKREISTTNPEDWSAFFKFRQWDDNMPKVSFISFYLPDSVVIFVDRPCKIDEEGYVVNLVEEPEAEEVAPV